MSDGACSKFSISSLQIEVPWIGIGRYCVFFIQSVRPSTRTTVSFPGGKLRTWSVSATLIGTVLLLLRCSRRLTEVKDWLLEMLQLLLHALIRHELCHVVAHGSRGRLRVYGWAGLLGHLSIRDTGSLLLDEWILLVDSTWWSEHGWR